MTSEMKLKSSNPFYHLAYWVFILITLTLVFGQKWENAITAFYFISLMMPIVLGTSYFFNYYLVPRFLLKKRLFKFGLYTIYTIIVSFYLEYIVLIYAYVYLAQYRFQSIAPNATDTILLGVILYLLVILGSVLLMLKQIKEKQLLIEDLSVEKEKIKRAVLELKSNRKLIKIPLDEILYIESMSDYIMVQTSNDRISSKERISHIIERLPSTFLRIHRSYIVNTDKISSANMSEISLADHLLPIGRSYKALVKEKIL